MKGGKKKNVWMAWSSCSIWQKKWEQVALLLNDEAVYILKFTDMSSSNRFMIEDEKITYSLSIRYFDILWAFFVGVECVWGGMPNLNRYVLYQFSELASI